MKPLRVYRVVPKLPPKLEALWTLAYNYWFAWNTDLSELFAQIDPQLWLESRHNPVTFINRLPQKVLDSLSRDAFFIERLKAAETSLKHYLSKTESYVPFPHKEKKQPAVVYFSAEYGIALSLPIYSGGLGILAGDHLKSASDLNIPLVAVGLCYREGYFRQYMTPDAWQQESYPDYDYDQLPTKVVLGPDEAPVLISVDLKGEDLKACIRTVQVGRITLYLLDANIPENPPHLRQITARLYGGDLEMRLRQEILLGIGGVRAMRALGLDPKVIHMNEGHSAFAGLERIASFMEEGDLKYESAQELVASSSVFTTHTPVPAGNDRFPPDLMQPYFEEYARRMGLSWKVLLALGREDPRDDSESFCMTVLALRLSRFNNGVSTLHGHVSRNMWQRVWPQYPVDDVPIGAITNGVHFPTWVAPDMSQLFERYLGMNWKEDPDCERVWKQADSIPDAELWRTHERLRERLVGFVRKRLRFQLQARGARYRDLELAEDVLDPQALTIGFARRFATYKRATLLLKDRDPPPEIDQQRGSAHSVHHRRKGPPQGQRGQKAHPGTHRVQPYGGLPQPHGLSGRLRHEGGHCAWVQGCDIWLNNPRRAPGGLRHQRHEGHGQRRAPVFHPGRLVGRGLAAGFKLRVGHWQG